MPENNSPDEMQIRHYVNDPMMVGDKYPAFQFQKPLSDVLKTDTNPSGLVTPQHAIDMYRTMFLARAFEDTWLALRGPKDKRPEWLSGIVYRGAAHLGQGEEANAAPLAYVLQEGDAITSTHRGHLHAIGIELDLEKMSAEMFGKDYGCCRGLGGSMHITGISKTGIRSLGANGIVGGSLGIGGGYAYAQKLLETGNIVISIAGDGAMNTGSFHEALNLASAWKAPVIYFIENNGSGISGRVEEVTNFKHSYDMIMRAAAYNLKGEVVDGTNVLAVLDAFKRAADHARNGNGPFLLLSECMRFGGHSASDALRYRLSEELDEWKAQDPIPKFRQQLVDAKVLTETEINDLESKVMDELQTAVHKTSKIDAPSTDIITGLVYSDKPDDRLSTIEVLTEPKSTSEIMPDIYRLTVFNALSQIMQNDSRVHVFGEDVGRYGNVHLALCESKNGERLIDSFPARVRDTPISEEAIAAFAMGMAMSEGVIPVAELMYSDFGFHAGNALFLQIAKAHFMYGGQSRVNLTIRNCGGGGKGYAAQHGGEYLFLYYAVPGWEIAVPSNPFDLKGLLNTAVYSGNPTLFHENLVLYNTPKFMVGNDVPEQQYRIPFGKASTTKFGNGKDATIWAYSRMADLALRAARDLEKEGINCTVIDPRTLSPLDLETLCNSVAETGHLIGVSQATYTGNITHDVIARCLMNLGPTFSARSVTALDSPVPTAENLEKSYFPDREKVMAAVRNCLDDKKPAVGAYKADGSELTRLKNQLESVEQVLANMPQADHTEEIKLMQARLDLIGKIVMDMHGPNLGILGYLGEARKLGLIK